MVYDHRRGIPCQTISKQSFVTLPAEPLILAIETATRAGSISLARGETILSTIVGDPAESHSRDLICNIDTVLHRGAVRLRDIDAFAVASGPGSFTGLRIGLATVKSFGVNTAKPCVAVSTLAAIADSTTEHRGMTVSLLPAGRGEVFAQLFSLNGSTIEDLDEAMHVSPKQLLVKYGHLDELIWAGEGAHVHVQMLRNWADAHGIAFRNGDDAASSFDDRRWWGLAARCNELSISIARLGLREYEQGQTLKPHELAATYVRPSDAEIPKPWQHQD